MSRKIASRALSTSSTAIEIQYRCRIRKGRVELNQKYSRHDAFFASARHGHHLRNQQGTRGMYSVRSNLNQRGCWRWGLSRNQLNGGIPYAVLEALLRGSLRPLLLCSLPM
ncbi:hypothetical protein SASPL_128623 [Salvia splendens]|uniref:Uncharacterized protein n=1 Tax=Salvia splendens TaxID=180675 RepID=A0A8X8ZMY6_SALSN|nr:hypothetical protein SASPL_128623 [Salvia splendens]